ncbi:GHKL domain-containing protein [Lysinibacillus sp. MHQ-1]|nr:GHKL domain-containing protein [Lysinibacillus sp. MHQ-1]
MRIKSLNKDSLRKKHENGKIRGQGLFIVKEIVHKYHGDISIESSKHLETTAIVHIPFK